MAKQYYVYQLVDPRTGNPFYVGKGKGNRIAAHEAEAKKGSNHPKCVHIREIEESGLAVERKIVKEFASEDAAYKFEAKLIKSIGRANLTNCADGGRNPLNYQPTDPQKAADSSKLDALLFLMRKTDGFNPAVYTYLGVKINLRENFFEKMKDQLAKILERQGKEFVLKHCEKYNVIINFVSKVENVAA
jgi:hypothetical protein